MNLLEIILLLLVFFFAFLAWYWRDRYQAARRAGILWRKRARIYLAACAAMGGLAWWLNKRKK